MSNTAGLTDTTTKTVTVDAPVQAPTARLTVTPTTGTAPVQVTADGSASTDPQGQTLHYNVAWGDGTSTGSQTAATATNTFGTAGSYTVALTETNTSGLRHTATKTVSVAAAPQAPTTRLTVTPTTGTAPVLVTANASTSTDPQGQTLRYSVDWGDGATTASQTAATATHTYTSAGSFTVAVTATNTSGLSNTAIQAVTVSPAPGYVGQVGTASGTTASKTGTLTVANPVKAGDLVVVTAQVSIGSNKPVTATDDAGNVYAVADSLSDATGAKLTTLYAVATKPLAAGAKITTAFQTATAYRLAADELTGVTTIDRTASATASTAAFSSGATKATAAPRELVFGVVGLSGGTTAPTWATGWTSAGTSSTGSGYIGRAYRTTTATGTFTATGTATGTWTAGVVTFRP